MLLKSDEDTLDILCDNYKIYIDPIVQEIKRDRLAVKKQVAGLNNL